MSDPQVTIDLARIERNARTVVARCARSGISVFGVTKGACGMPQVARAMLRGGVAGLAESRFENIRRLRDAGIDGPILLLRTPPASRIEEMVRNVDVSLQSELAVIREISRIAERVGRVHDIVLMVDLGDLREGIWPNDLVATVERVMELPGVRIAGLGTNLTCFGAIVPTEENLGQLVAHAYKVESVTGRPLDFVSGGNSSSLPLLLAGRMPAGINHLRIGEAILQGGRDTFLDEPWAELDRGAFELSGELLEVKVKPSLPIGKSGIDAFGQRPVFVDEGDRLRGIANIGREDVMVEGLVPVNAGVRVLGASSDHLLLDLTEADPPLAVGDAVSFRMSYGAMLAVMTSEYVEKLPMRDVEERPPIQAASVFASDEAAPVLAAQGVEARLAAIGFTVTPRAGLEPAGLAAGLSRGPVLLAGPDRRIALAGVAAAARARDAVGLIWLDSAAAMMPDAGGVEPAEDAVLTRILAGLPPKLSAENVVLVGLRHADPAEAAALKASRASVFTMVEIDATGLRDVMREAIRIASAGVRGFHLAYSPTVSDLPGWREGGGGITVRETHQAMEAVARHGGMASISVSGLSAGLDPLVAAECGHFIASAFGKRIL